MNANEIIMAVMAVFFVIAAADRCLNGRLGFAGELERGFSMLGVMALNVVGVVCIAPLIARLLQPVVLPVFEILGADPAMFSGCILSPDSGGYSIAAELSGNPELICFGGLLVSMILGTVVCFTIPVSCGLLEDEQDIRYFAVGVLAAFSVSPWKRTMENSLSARPGSMLVTCTLVPRRSARRDRLNCFTKALEPQYTLPPA